MIEETLRKIGFTDGETRVYLALLETGVTSSGKIIKKSRISGSKVYEILNRLIQKGVVSSTVINDVKHFEAASPERILDYLNEKEVEIKKERVEVEKIIPQLLLKKKETQTAAAKIYTGWEGMKTANREIINSLNKGEKWLSMGLTHQPDHWRLHFDHDQRDRAKKGIIFMGLHNKKYSNYFGSREVLPNTELRTLPKDFEMPTSMEIFKNKVCIFIMEPQSPISIMIESKAVADSFRKYFYAIWDKYK